MRGSFCDMITFFVLVVCVCLLVFCDTDKKLVSNEEVAPMGNSLAKTSSLSCRVSDDEGLPIGGGENYSDIITYDGIARNSFHVVTDAADFVNVVTNAGSVADTVFIPANLSLDLTSYPPITIAKNNLTIASERGKVTINGSIKTVAKGGLLHRSHGSGNLFRIWNRNNVRFTGLRLRGPGGTGILNAGLDVYNSIDVEIDNCEIYNWPQRGICVNNCNVDIHHNDIHANLLGGGEDDWGYGIMVGGENGYATVKSNIFDSCRHCVSGTGNAGVGYEASWNNITENQQGHCFDMHGGVDHGWSVPDRYMAGRYMHIHDNCFYVSTLNIAPSLFWWNFNLLWCLGERYS